MTLNNLHSSALSFGTSPADLLSVDAALVDSLNAAFVDLAAEKRVELAAETLPQNLVLSSSFGAQSAVALHLLNSIVPNLPVILIDTGYLFPETYEFVSAMTDRLDLNLHVYTPRMTAAMQEAMYGQRWLDGVEGLDAYNHDNKVEPMQRALAELQAGTWFSGIRRSQAASRAETPFVQIKDRVAKVSPLADWSDRDVFEYLQRHDLPYHPLWHEGFISIGDVHTTKSLAEVNDPSETRFFGLKRECGLHA